MALQSAKRQLTNLLGTNASRNLTDKETPPTSTSKLRFSHEIHSGVSVGWLPGLEPCPGWSPARAGALPGLEPCQGWSPARAGALPGLEPCHPPPKRSHPGGPVGSLQQTRKASFQWCMAEGQASVIAKEHEEELQTYIYVFRLWMVALKICAGLAEGASTNY